MGSVKPISRQFALGGVLQSAPAPVRLPSALPPPPSLPSSPPPPLPSSTLELPSMLPLKARKRLVPPKPPSAGGSLPDSLKAPSTPEPIPPRLQPGVLGRSSAGCVRVSQKSRSPRCCVALTKPAHHLLEAPAIKCCTSLRQSPPLPVESWLHISSSAFSAHSCIVTERILSHPKVIVSAPNIRA